MTRSLLITGAAGRIGSFLTAQWRERYTLSLTDVRPVQETFGLPFQQTNLTDFDTVRGLVEGIDTVVHLGGDPRMDAKWDSMLPNNVISTYNVFEAAHQAHCRRVVFASSVNAVLGYPVDKQVHTDMPTRPVNLYGATKVWGEGLASTYAAAGLSCICLRFGWVVDRDSPMVKHGHPLFDTGLTYHDLTRLVGAAIEADDDLDYAVFHGVSNNRWKRLDISDARTVIGYDPQDDVFELAKRNAETK